MTDRTADTTNNGTVSAGRAGARGRMWLATFWFRMNPPWITGAVNFWASPSRSLPVLPPCCWSCLHGCGSWSPEVWQPALRPRRPWLSSARLPKRPRGSWRITKCPRTSSPIFSVAGRSRRGRDHSIGSGWWCPRGSFAAPGEPPAARVCWQPHGDLLCERSPQDGPERAGQFAPGRAGSSSPAGRPAGPERVSVSLRRGISRSRLTLTLCLETIPHGRPRGNPASPPFLFVVGPSGPIFVCVPVRAYPGIPPYFYCYVC